MTRKHKPYYSHKRVIEVYSTIAENAEY